MTKKKSKTFKTVNKCEIYAPEGAEEMVSDKCTLCRGKRKIHVFIGTYKPKITVAIKCQQCLGTGLEPWRDSAMDRLLNQMQGHRSRELSDKFWLLDNEEVVG